MTKLKHFLITIFFLSIGMVKGYSYSFETNGIYYNIISATDKTVEVTSRNGYICYYGDIVIPQFVNYNNTQYQVIRIGANAFHSNKITSIKLPEGLHEIGNHAFQNCYELTKVELPEGPTSIGDGAFIYCDALTSIKLPEGLQKIGDQAFYSCVALTNVELQEGLQEIGDQVFSKCDALTNVELPEGLIGIGSFAFNGCRALTNIELPNSLEYISGSAFQNCSLTSINLPNKIKSIGERAFTGCNIKSVTIPASVLKLYDSSFPSAKKIIFLGNTKPSEITSSITIDRRCYVSSKANYGFGVEYANLSSMFEVGGVKYVLVSAKDRTCDIIDCAYNSSAENIVIDSLVTYRNIKLKVRNINDNAFYENDSIQSAVIKNNGYIGAYAFQGCDSVENVTLGNSVDSVFSFAFSNCTKLKEITIPNNVPYLGSHCFDDSI